MSQQIARAVYTRLTANLGETGTNPLKAAVGDRVYAIEAPASSALPLVVWTMEDPDVSRFFGGKTRLTATFTVSIFDKADAGVDSLGAIEGHAFDLLDDEDVSVVGYDRGVIHSVARGSVVPDGDYMRSDSTFKIVATESP